MPTATRSITVDLTPPDTTALAELTARVDDLSITNPREKAAAASLLVDVRRFTKELEARFAAIKKPLNEARSKLLAEERVTLAAPKALAQAVEREILAYDRIEERKRQQELARRQAEADAAAAEARAAEAKDLRAAAKTAPKPIAKQLRAKAAAVAVAEPEAVAIEVPPPVETPGLSKRTTWKAEIEDVRLLVTAVAGGSVPLEAIEPQQLEKTHPFLNSLARRAGGALSIPGVRPVKVERLQ